MPIMPSLSSDCFTCFTSPIPGKITPFSQENIPIHVKLTSYAALGKPRQRAGTSKAPYTVGLYLASLHYTPLLAVNKFDEQWRNTG